MSTKKHTSAFVAVMILVFTVSSLSVADRNAQAGFDPFITIELALNAGNEHREQIAFYIQQDLARIGIEVQPVFLDWGTYVTRLLDYDQSNPLQMFIIGLGGVSGPDWSFAYHSEGELNLCNMNDSLSDQLFDEGNSYADPSDSKPAYDQLQQHIMSDVLPIVPLYSGHDYEANWAQLDGYDPYAGLHLSLPDMVWTTPNERGSSTEIITGSPYGASDTLFDAHIGYYDTVYIADMIYPQLIEYDSNGFMDSTIGNSLSASTPEIIENPDGSVNYIFHLRDDMYWEDGVQVNATDVEFTFDLSFYSGNTQYWNGDKYSGITSDELTTVIDEFTFNVTTFETNSEFYFDAAPCGIHPEHILNLRDSTGQELYDGITNSYVWSEYAKHPLSGGAWYLDQWVHDDYQQARIRDSTVTGWTGNYDALAAAYENDSYNGVTGFYEPPTVSMPEWHDADSYSIRTLRRTFRTSHDGLVDQLVLGELDFVEILESSFDQVSQNPDLEIQTRMDDVSQFVGFNLEDPLLGTGELTPVGAAGNGGLNLRKAIYHAIDRDRIVADVLEGHCTMADSFMYPSQFYWYYPTVYEHDIDLAMTYMAAAGYVHDGEVFETETSTDVVTESLDPITEHETVTVNPTETYSLTETTTVTETSSTDTTTTTGSTSTTPIIPFSWLAAVSGVVTMAVVMCRRRRRT